MMTNPDSELTSNFNLTRKTFKFGHHMGETDKTNYYNELVGEVRRKNARDRHIGKSKDTSAVCLTGNNVNQPKQNNRKKNVPKPGPQPMKDSSWGSTPANPNTQPNQTQKGGKGKGKGKPNSNGLKLCGSMHRWGLCARLSTCWWAETHTNLHKPPDVNCLCPVMLTTSKCSKDNCTMNHSDQLIKSFWESKTGSLVKGVIEKGGSDLEKLKNRSYITMNKVGPSGPWRCFACNEIEHKREQCPKFPDPMECHGCGGDHKRMWCWESQAWATGTCGAKRQKTEGDFREGRTAA